eukprot:TRINITY_DN3009_c0_g1_i1.p1 TRINITY_DN3009_c0_g1~~TRINITY_DN3009_c0_g1_i1.p1  ORF type:complete len:120 (+),score=2.84 TRINITY_DN3009_c0_g1_i1:125-484(+)
MNQNQRSRHWVAVLNGILTGIDAEVKSRGITELSFPSLTALEIEITCGYRIKALDAIGEGGSIMCWFRLFKLLSETSSLLDDSTEDEPYGLVFDLTKSLQQVELELRTLESEVQYTRQH